MPPSTSPALETTVKYAGYLRRQESEIERARRTSAGGFRRDFPFDRCPGFREKSSSGCRRFGPTRSATRFAFLA